MEIIMPNGKELIGDIDSCVVGPGEVAAWWTGQLGYIFKTISGVLYVDVYLSPKHPDRRVKPLLQDSEVTNADWIAGSHDHFDHIDRDCWPAMAAASPKAKFLVPDYFMPQIADDLHLPRERFVGMDDGVCKTLAPDLQVTALASSHVEFDRDPKTGKHPYIGFVVQAGGCTFYHSGDGLVYPGLADKLAPFSPRAMFLPINGRDNMSIQAAADLAAEVGCRLVVPSHFDMFPCDVVPDEFVAYARSKYPKLRVHVPRYGERFSL